jgi:hypothetical protein
MMLSWLFGPRKVEVVIKGPIHIHIDGKLDGLSISQGSQVQVHSDNEWLSSSEERSSGGPKATSNEGRRILPEIEDLGLPDCEFGEET